MAKLNFFYGIHSVEALLGSQATHITEVFVLKNRDSERIKRIIALAEDAAIHITRLSRRDMDKLVDSSHHQGIAVTSKHFKEFDEKTLEALLVQQQLQQKLFLVLDGVQDPHNLGACLRSANAFGAQAVIIPRNRAVGLTATVRKVASGADVSTPVIRVTNLARTLRTLQEKGIWIVGASTDCDTPIKDIDFTSDIALVLGSEGSGLRHLTQSHCDFLAHIPIRGCIESLNVSVAAAIALYEVQRQRSL